ncbi:MAG: aminomethyl-transferring glycine dehydrogenase subunit GcvPA [Thermovirgaceae bacterium]
MSKSKMAHPYIPNSDPRIQEEMLEAIGVPSIDEFYKGIPEELRVKGVLNLPGALPAEWDLKRHVEDMMQENVSCRDSLSFLGGGCWQHHVPAVCDEINRRSEFLTAYAGEPYEDHGRFQALFEYASMMAELVDMDAVNVPTYDGSQAAATSLRMASRITGKNRVVVAANSHPDRIRVIQNYCHPDIAVDLVDFDENTGTVDVGKIETSLDGDTAAVYIENPSYFGAVETRGGKIAEKVHEAGGLLVVGCDPSSLGVFAPPASHGADIVCGDLQPLGMHMYYGGARAGFIATRDEEKFVSEYPSRLFGIAPTSHKEWGFGDVAWERLSFHDRENAKEFVGTAAALWAITAGVYLGLMGPRGMRELGEGILKRNAYARKRLSSIPGVKPLFPEGAFFKDFALNFDGTKKSVKEINDSLRAEGIFGCVDLSAAYPALGESGLFAVTEIHSAPDIDRLASALQRAVA